MLETVERFPGITLAEVASLTQIDPVRVRSTIYQAKRRGELEKYRDGHKGLTGAQV